MGSRPAAGCRIRELVSPSAAAEEDRLLGRREHERDARGRRRRQIMHLPFTDRVIVTLVYLRFRAPARGAGRVVTGCTDPRSPARSARSARCWPRAGSPCPASPASGCAPWPTCLAYASARGVTLRIDGTEPCSVRRPQSRTSRRPGRAFVSRKKKMNTAEGRPSSPTRRAVDLDRPAAVHAPAALHDQTAVRIPRASLTDLPAVPAGQGQGRCRVPGAGRGIPGQVQAPPPKPKKDTPSGRDRSNHEVRDATSSHRSGSASSTPTAEPQAMAQPLQRLPRTTRSTSTRPTPPSPAGLRPRRPAVNPSKPTRQVSRPQR